MTTLVLIRHGQASFGQAHYDELSELGEKQARITGHHLNRLGLRFDALLSGEMDRQKATAEHAAAALEQPPPIETRPAFNEYDADGLFKAYLPRVLSEDAELAAQQTQLFKDRKVFQRAFAQVARKWLSDEPHEVEGFEGWSDFRERVEAGLMALHRDFGRDARLGLFTSGGPIAVAVGAALGLSDEATIQVNWTIYNAAATELRSHRTGWRLMGFNNITHLRLENDPALITHR